jgi:hypothetical protein
LPCAVNSQLRTGVPKLPEASHVAHCAGPSELRRYGARRQGVYAASAPANGGAELSVLP